MSWVPYALLSALFAALTAIFGKMGVQNIDSNLAVAIRTSVIVLLAWGIVLVQRSGASAMAIPRHSMLFLILSALATGFSWLFYYKALQLGPASRVAPVDKLSVALTMTLAFALLGEKPTPTGVAGGALIVAGAVLVAWGR